ncbi:MAG: hypothetical protein AAFO74_01495 [Pseudomonadota bacterium]
MFAEIALPPLFATAIFVIAVFSGYQYRKVWKSEGPAWKAWLFGGVTALCFATVAFVPLQTS